LIEYLWARTAAVRELLRGRLAGLLAEQASRAAIAAAGH
jgi:hypothetical protein